MITATTLSVFWTVREYNRFDVDVKKQRDNYINEQKSVIKFEAERASDHINYVKSKTINTLRQILSEKVNESYNIAQNIYQKNKGTKSESEIKKMIGDALRTIRYNKNRGYIYIYSLDGYEILNSKNPNNENKNRITLTDSMGRPVIQNEINFLKTHDEGFIDYNIDKKTINWDKKDSKIAYIKLFKPYRWYIGSKEYLTDFKKDIQEDVLDRISKIRFGSDGYIFINTLDGKSLIKYGKILNPPQDILKSGDTNWINIFHDQANIKYNANKSGFIEYLWKEAGTSSFSKKITYVRHIPEWGWIVGAGTNRDKIENDIQIQRAQLNQKINQTIFQILCICICILIIIYFLARLLAKQTGQSIAVFTTFFEKAASEFKKIDSSRLYFSEFKKLADSANDMLEAREKIQRNLEEEQILLREAKEKAEESDRLKTAFLANMSHEIRTPMNSIIGFSDLLSDDEITKEEKNNYVAHINTAGNSLLNLINDILDIAKIEAGQIIITKSDCDINALFNELYLTFTQQKEKLNKKELTIIHNDQPSKKRTIYADPQRLKQIMTNLLGNALKFTEKGFIEFGVDLVSPNKYMFFVKDTGIGISTENQQLIFKRFIQVDGSHTRNYGGTGLGLSISKNLVELMGGKLWVDSVQGQGSTFYFTLPLK
jgi:signal transduction histidine kinase